MSAFVFGDMHGRWDLLQKLLTAAGILNEEGLITSDDLVISVGDLVNATMADARIDEEMIEKAMHVVDWWVVGNHDIVYSHPHLSFRGFSPSPVVRTHYNTWLRQGKLVPAVMIGNTLITHAGVNKAFDFQTAEEAFDAIYDVWMNYNQFANPVPGGSQPMKGAKPWQFNGKRYDWATLLDGIGFARGGRAEVAGILWDDWGQPKNTNFSQVMGHTPIDTGPVFQRHLGSNIFTTNIDSGAKSGRTPWGVWLDEDGEVMDFQTAEVEDDGNKEN